MRAPVLGVSATHDEIRNHRRLLIRDHSANRFDEELVRGRRNVRNGRRVDACAVETRHRNLRVRHDTRDALDHSGHRLTRNDPEVDDRARFRRQDVVLDASREHSGRGGRVLQRGA